MTGRAKSSTLRAEAKGSAREKWGSALDAGFQIVPNVLIRAQKQLGLDAVDVLILLNLNLHWWGPNRLPFPKAAMIANRMGVSKRTIERRLNQLEKKGFIARAEAVPSSGGMKVRPYHMAGLVAHLERAADIGISRQMYRSPERRRNHEDSD